MLNFFILKCMICVEMKGLRMDLQLKRIRTLCGFSQDDMAKRLGIKKSRYGTWERGERMMSLEQAYEVTEVLGCTLDELCGRKVERSYFDPDQAALNGYYESMNDGGRTLLVETAESISADPKRRMFKDGRKNAGSERAMGA